LYGGGVGLFNVKVPNSTKNWGHVPNHSDPNTLGPIPKFKIMPPILSSPRSEDPKKVSHIPAGLKLRVEIDLIETGLLGQELYPGGQLMRPMPKNYLYRVGLVLKISSRSLHSIKSF